MTITVTVVLLISLALFAVTRWMRSALPRQHEGVSLDLLERWFRELLSSTVDSVVVINVRGAALTLQFRHQLRHEASEILFEYPKAEWSVPYFQKVQALAAGLGYEIEFVSAGPERRHEHMLVWLGRDASAAGNLALNILINIYGVSPEHDCRAYLPSARETRSPDQTSV